MHTKTEENSLTDLLTNFNINVGSFERIGSAIAGGALITYGLKHGGILGGLLSVAGGVLALRGITGHCQMYDALNIDTSDKSPDPDSPYHKGFLDQKIHVTESVTINKSAAELYSFWRNFENLPKFMNHLESVTVLGDKRSHWKAKAPMGMSVEWDAILTSDIENERLGWKSTEDSEVINSGVVLFQPTIDSGTIVKVVLTYEPPAGKLGEYFAKLFGEEPHQQVSDDLHRFKSLMESGEAITTEGQTSGRRPEAKNASA